ncbi:GGDEF domain-containing protein [Marinobacterium nitratireducens]|uniref:GGDEF domain-containing protein n=1 Tax=Marinobacterium nitratireducens TaxID=518897 RepID=A0A917Z852_9GAMM|nr:EAL domain-containing protein [Marinobacterium nitratireducens]GGO77739.1 GGDEF domain-containing protein [Marinobacterium nitratireducens]
MVTLRTRYSATLALVTFGVCGLLLLFSLYMLQNVYQQVSRSAQQAVEQGVARQLSRDALLLGETLAGNLALPVYHNDFSAIEEILQHLRQRAEIGYIFVYDPDLRVIHDGTAEVNHYGTPVSQLIPAGLDDHFQPSARTIDDLIHVTFPVTSGSSTIGAVRFSVSFSDARTDTAALTSQLDQAFAGFRQQVVIGLVLAFLALMAVTLLLSLGASRRLMQPLQELAALSRNFRANDESVRFSLQRDDEIGELAEALEQMRRRVQQSHKTISRMAFRDPLTGLANRRFLQQELERLLSAGNDPLALLFIDLDHFKAVNDSAGHEVGDQVLRNVASRLESIARSLDGEALVARLGGDEFTLVLPQLPHPDAAGEVAERVAGLLQIPVEVARQQFRVSASIGITLFPDDGFSPVDLMRHADTAMYEAKQAGRNRFCFFEQSMNQRVHEHLLVLQGIDQALAEHQLFLEYQPVFDLQRDVISGAEALVRWRHPRQGLVSPASFIPIVEESDRIEALTLWVLTQACRDLRDRILPRAPGFKLSLNVSGVALQSDSLRDRVLETLSREGVSPASLRLEITETTMMRDIEKSAETLKLWQQAGLRILIDDFGTGYSSLSYLTSLPIDGLKIDRSFISQLQQSSQGPVVDAILALSRTLGIETIAEGIETQEQLQLLRQMRASHGQGYLLGRPMPVSQLRTLLEHPQPLHHSGIMS